MGVEQEVYKILLKRHLNDDRLMGERSSIFIASSAILFGGFAVLTGHPLALRIIICVVGTVLCILAIRANHRTKRGLDFWDEKESKLENYSHDELFISMREREVQPSMVYNKIGQCFRNRDIFTWYIPIAFILLWIGSFVWALIESA